MKKTTTRITWGYWFHMFPWCCFCVRSRQEPNMIGKLAFTKRVQCISPADRRTKQDVHEARAGVSTGTSAHKGRPHCVRNSSSTWLEFWDSVFKSVGVYIKYECLWVCARVCATVIHGRGGSCSLLAQCENPDWDNDQTGHQRLPSTKRVAHPVSCLTKHCMVTKANNFWCSAWRNHPQLCLVRPKTNPSEAAGPSSKLTHAVWTKLDSIEARSNQDIRHQWARGDPPLNLFSANFLLC